MPVQQFKSIFTADARQYSQELSVLRQTTQGVIGDIRSSFVALAGMSFAGIGAKELVTDIIRLGAEMQQTKTAFEVMLGSAEKGSAIIAELNRFADVTPFDNDEVIRSGRLLLNAGVSTDQLSKKLTNLGNIAAGSQIPLVDMVAIYAKAANKGKVQAEELNQLSERGVPVMQAMATTLGRTTQQILDMGAKGQLSFGLLDEALSSLAEDGGKYFGLMEKQSQNLAGRWSSVSAAVRNAGIAIGEEAIPALSAALNEFSAALDEMAKSGELDKIVRETARSLGEIAQNLKNITVWMVKHQEQMKTIAGGALWIGVAMKAHAIIKGLAAGMVSLGAAHAAQAGAAAASAGATAAAGTAAAAASIKVGVLTKAFTGLGMVVGAASAMLATAFVGWQIGKVLGELMQLDEVFTRLILKKQGLTDAEIDSASSAGTLSPSIPKVDLAQAEREKSALEQRLQELAKIKLPTETADELAQSTPAIEGDLARVNQVLVQAQAESDKRLEELAATDDNIRSLLNQREALEKRLAGRQTAGERKRISAQIVEIETRTGEYQTRAEAEIAAIDDTKNKIAAAYRKLQDLRARQKEAEKNRTEVLPGTYNNAQVPGLDASYQQPTYEDDYRGEIEAASKDLERLNNLLLSQRKTGDEYKAAQAELAEYKAAAGVQRAETLSAADQFRADEQKRLHEEVAAHLAKLTKSETELKRAEWAKQVASYRDAYRDAGLETPEQTAALDQLEAEGYKAINEERRKKQQAMYDHMAKLTGSETDLKKRELQKQLDAYKAAGASQQQLARVQALGMLAIEREKNSKILAAHQAYIAARRNQAEASADMRVDRMVSQLNTAAEKIRTQLGKFDFSLGDDWKRLAGSARARAERRRQVAMDESIDAKMGVLAQGGRARFTAPERERIREREKLEERLANRERRAARIQEQAGANREQQRRQELDRAVADARKKLDAERRDGMSARRMAPQNPAQPSAPRKLQVPQSDQPPAQTRNIAIRQDGQQAPAGVASAAVQGVAGSVSYTPLLQQMLSEIQRLSQQVFVVKGGG